MNWTTASGNTTEVDGLQLNTTQTATLSGEKCLQLQFDDYIPWDNPDNLISAKTEILIDQLKCVAFLPLSFLIGGPGNVINMAVFWKLGLRERINLCLFALSLADEMYLVQCMFINGERIYTQFSTEERYGPFTKWMTNHYLVGFFGFTWVSQAMSAIIASERCFCVVSPLRSQIVLTTRTMAIIIIVFYIVIVGLYFLVASRYHIDCVVDPVSGVSFNAVVGGEFYHQNKEFIHYLDYFVYGVGIPGIVIIIVTTTTIITTVQLRRKAVWRKESSSAVTLSSREVALTKMLIAASVLFIVCVFPILLFRFVLLFIPELNAGRRHHNAFFAVLWLLEIFSYVNSSVNVVIYYAMGSRYRQTLKRMMRRRGKTSAKDSSRVSEVTVSTGNVRQ